MRDYRFVHFSLGHHAGDSARQLLADCELLDVALSSRANRGAWSETLHTGVSLRLHVEDKRLPALLERLRAAGNVPFTRLDREYSSDELDAAEWLLMRVATAGLYGGVDYGQSYRFDAACRTCGAGAELVPPLLAELGLMGKKDIDHLVFEQHLVVRRRIATALEEAGVTGVQPMLVQTPRRPPGDQHVWLRITSEFPRLHASSTGYVIDPACPQCGRSGHHGMANEPEVPRYSPVPADTPDITRTWEYFGDWRQVRGRSFPGPVGGSQDVVVSQRARRVLQRLEVRRLVWVPLLPA